MRYRIVEVTTGSKTHFRVQHRFLFIWWFEMDFWCDHLGGYGEFPIEFHTIESAQQYVSNQTQTIKILS